MGQFESYVGPYCTVLVRFGLFWVILVEFGSFLGDVLVCFGLFCFVLDHLGSFWISLCVILGRFELFRILYGRLCLAWVLFQVILAGFGSVLTLFFDVLTLFGSSCVVLD